MSRQIEADHSQAFLLPPSIEDWVGADHPARFVRDFVDALDLPALGFGREHVGLHGRPHFGPALLLRLWLWASLRGVSSARRLEAACREEMGAIWLCACQAPDHNTLWRFWREHREALCAVFGHSVRVAARLGLVGLALHALDGTKIAVAGSARGERTRQELESRLGELDARIAILAQQIDETCAAEAGQDDGYRLSAAMEQAQARRGAIAEALAQEGPSALLLSEPEARRMVMGSGGKIGWAHNAQACVDATSGLIVACDLDNEAHDAHHLVKMVEQARANLGQQPGVTVADTAYGRSERELAQAQALGQRVLTARPAGEERPYHRSQFVFDRATSTCQCPLGVTMRLQDRRRRRDRPWLGEITRFVCPQASTCPARAQCCRGKRPRLVEFTACHEALSTQRRRARSPIGQGLMQLRRQVVEPVFGHVKRNLGFTRFTVRGLAAARTQWHLICLGINLWRMQRLLAKRIGP